MLNACSHTSADAIRGHSYALLLAACAAALLSACATVSLPGGPEASAATTPEAAIAAGDYRRAASLYEEQAADAPPRSASAFWVGAADAWLLAGDGPGARRALREVSQADLGHADRSRFELVLADLALRAGRPQEAEALLQRALQNLPESAEQRYRGLQEQTWAALTGPVSNELALAIELGRQPGGYDPDIAVEILRLLESVSTGELALRSENPRGDRTVVGWLDLALVVRDNLVVTDSAGQAIAGWKRRHPFHLLSESEALDTWLRYRQRFLPPLRTAVLLPDSPGLKAASEALRDGLLSAFLNRPGGGELMFFATGDDPQSTIAAYFSALDAGADQILGPLRKESVEALLNVPGLSTPVLALNDLPAEFVSPAGLNGRISGLSLSQEAEIAAAANQAASLGYRRAVVLAPESDWGERMAAAFQADFLRDDRQVIAAARYPESENDHSALLERLLRIDESKARKRALENTLTLPLEFEPVRREDVDVIFLAANSTQARLIRPQLRFLDAGEVPVYAAGRVYSGRPDPARNQDLDGVRFPATPWELAHATEDEVPRLASLRDGTFGALFALGQDAWNMLSWLSLMHKDPGFVFTGQSGRYRMSADGRLQRDPAWGEFSLGIARAFDPPAPVRGSPADTLETAALSRSPSEPR